MYQGLDRKENDNANYLLCFVLYDPSLDQRNSPKKGPNFMFFFVQLSGIAFSSVLTLVLMNPDLSVLKPL